MLGLSFLGALLHLLVVSNSDELHKPTFQSASSTGFANSLVETWNPKTWNWQSDSVWTFHSVSTIIAKTTRRRQNTKQA